MSEAESPSTQKEIIDLETDNYIETYQIISEWIRFADAKAAAVLMVDGALIGVLVPMLKPWLKADHPGAPAFLPFLVLALFGGWLLLVGLSGIWAFRCIIPFRRKGRHPSLEHCKHFHPASVSTHYRLEDIERFSADCDTIGMHGLKREVQAAVLIDSHISSAKYRRVTIAIQFLACSAVLGFLYIVAIQF